MDIRRESEHVPENKPTEPYVEDEDQSASEGADPGPAENLEPAPDEGVRKQQGGL